ncbi:MAG: ankyrin repeat domain-containing protein [Myxococcota bacterium]
MANTPTCASAADELSDLSAAGTTASANLQREQGGQRDLDWSPVQWSGLHLAAARGDLGETRALLRAGAMPEVRGGPSARDGAGVTPLHCAAAAGHVEVVEALLAAGAHPDRRDAAGYAAVHLAASAGHTAVIKALARAGADPLQTVVGYTALDLARRGRYHRTAALLMQLEGCWRGRARPRPPWSR